MSKYEPWDDFSAKATVPKRTWLRTFGLYLLDRDDVKRFDAYANTTNGSARLTAFHDAVLDADDTMQAAERAIGDGDYAEAGALLKLGRESLAGRITELKGML